VASTRRVREIAARAPSVFAPQCGLAPGFISIVGADLAARFERLDSLRLRVGALPRFPVNALGYALTWSPEGLINEYCEPCDAVVEGARCQVRPLEGLERFFVDGVAYEAFNTSGGLGGLCETFAGRAREINYRTIRYPGHAAAMKLLLGDLRLRERRDLLKTILEAALPSTRQDVVVILAAAAGWRDGRLVEESYVHRLFGDESASAIQTATAAGLCAVLDLVAAGRLPQSGLLAQETVPLELFLTNRFGAAYAPRAAPLPIAAE
jgi:saccharopine dehydrogenase-like NADP-dependent oxidoreductase